MNVAIAATDWAEKFPKFKLHRVTCRDDDDGRWPLQVWWMEIVEGFTTVKSV